MTREMQGKATVAHSDGHGAVAKNDAAPAEVLVVDDEPVTARVLRPRAGGRRLQGQRGPRRARGGRAGQGAALRRDRQRHRHARHGRAGAPARHSRDRSRRAHDLHDRQPGAGERAGRHRVRRVSLPGQADRARRDDRRGGARGARPQAGAGPARGGGRARAGGEADRRSRGPRGAVRLGGREAVGRRAADRLLVGAPHVRLRDAAADRRADAAEPARLLRHRRATGAGGRARADHPPARGAPSCARRRPRRPCSSTCTRPISRTTSSTPTTAR